MLNCFITTTSEHSEKEKLETDPMYKLDHGGKDKEKLRAAIPSLTELQDHQASWKNDFQLNSTLRRKFRVCTCKTVFFCFKKRFYQPSCVFLVFASYSVCGLQMQNEKKVIADEEEKDNVVRARTGLSIPLVPEREEDKKLASLLTLQSADCESDVQIYHSNTLVTP